jgi:hypothetical protein
LVAVTGFDTLGVTVDAGTLGVAVDAGGGGTLAVVGVFNPRLFIALDNVDEAVAIIYILKNSFLKIFI